MKENARMQEAADARRVLVLRIDTTGTSLDRDEILRVCILEASGPDASPRPVFDSKFKPLRHTYWPAAERRNGISPAQVARAPFFSDKLDELNALLATADGIVCYNADFDIPFLRAQGAIFPRNAAVFDVMRDWSYHRAGVNPNERDVPWVSASDMAEGLRLIEPGKGLEDRTGFLRCAFRRLALAGIVTPKPFAGGVLQDWSPAILAAIASPGPAPQVRTIQAQPYVPRPVEPGPDEPEPEAPKAEAPRTAAPAEAPGGRFSNEEIQALNRRLDGAAPEDLDALLGKPSPGFFTDAGGNSHQLESPISRLMGCEEMSYEDAVAWLMEREDAILKARDARLQASAKAACPAGEEGDEAFCCRCQDAFAAAAKTGYVLPGTAKLEFAMRLLEDGRIACRAAVADPDGMLYAEGQTPACAAVYRAKREGARIDPAAAAGLFAAKLAKPGMLPAGLGAFCSAALKAAAAKAAAPEEAAEVQCSKPAA